MQKTIRLQGLGLYKADSAKDIKVGDSLVWNFGETSTVTSITKETEKSIWIEETCKSGNTYNRRFLKTRPVKILKKC